MTPERLERRRQRITLAALTAGILGLICGVAAVLVQRSNSEEAVQRAVGQNVLLVEQNRELYAQLASMSDSLAKQQELSRCWMERATRADLVGMAFFGLYIPGQDGKVIDVAEFNRQLEQAKAEAKDIDRICPPT